MMERFISIFILASATCTIQALQLPEYIKPCSINDPDFGQCAIKYGMAAIPRIAKGDKQFNIPSLDPLVLPEVNFTTLGSLHLHATEVVVKGIPTFNMLNVGIDKNKKEMSVEGIFPLLDVKGKYKVNGKLLTFNIEGDGDLKVDLHEMKERYTFNWADVQKDGKTYIKVLGDKSDLSTKKMTIHLQNLFGKDPEIDKELNGFLNANWKDVFADIGPVISQIISTVVRKIIDGLAEKVPADGLFLDYNN